MGSKIRILSPDGGGNRGIIPATIMVEIESRLQKKLGQPDSRLSNYFNLIASTSTGGILTGPHLCPDEHCLRGRVSPSNTACVRIPPENL